MRRLLGSLTVAAVACGSFLVGVAPVAEARSQPPMTIREGDPIVATFPGIPGNFSGNAAAIPTPIGCVDGAPFSATCDTVPLDVIPPNVDEATDWTLFLEVTWTPSERNDNEVQSVQACDLDVYLWDDTQIAKRNDPESGTYTRFTASESATQPEQMKTYAPSLGRYNLTVVNFSGVNIDYTVKAWIGIGTFERPFELLAPSGTVPSSGDDEDTAPPEDLSDERPAPASVVPLLEDAPPPALAEIAVLPDSDFLDFDNGSSFETHLQRPAQTTGLGGLPTLTPADDVAPAVLLFWFLIVPLALGGAGWVFLMRRNRGMLSLRSS